MAQYMFLAPAPSLPFSPLSKEAFEEIKRVSGSAWKQQALHNKDGSTTYSGAYGNVKVETATHCNTGTRPTSPTRINRPHPPEVFLVNQLHYLPGHYGNAKQRVVADKGCPPPTAFPYKRTASDLEKGQAHQPKFKHAAVVVSSPVTPLDTLQELVQMESLNAVLIGNRCGQEIEAPSSSLSREVVFIPTGLTCTDSEKQSTWDSEATSEQ